MPSVMILQNSEGRHNANSIQMLLENRLIPTHLRVKHLLIPKIIKQRYHKTPLQTNILHDQRWKKPS